jgi:hypothetical protein
MALKRVLITTDTGLTIEASAQARVFFNPSQYQMTRKVDWKDLGNRGGTTPQLHFDKGGPRTLSMSLLFDTYESGTDVRALTGQVAKLAEIDTTDNKKGRPPVCTIVWGPRVDPYAGLPFTGVVESLTQKFTLFLEDGTPVRATLDINFKEGESPERQRRRNPPRSGSPLQGKVRVVRQGDSLWGLAAEEYGDPAKWRPIADANGIDNPRDLTPGTELLIPTLGEGR